MFKILVILIGTFLGAPINLHLTSDTIFEDIDNCKLNLGSESVRKDIIAYTSALKVQGYDLSIDKYECISIDQKS